MPATFTPILSTLNVNPGEGLCVFFYDATYEFSGGGIGNSLGYTNYVGAAGYKNYGETTTYNGIQGAVLGVGFDVKGGFGTVNNNKTGHYNVATGGNPNAGYTSLSANSITTRLGVVSSYAIINTTPNLSTFPTPVTLHQHVSSRDDVVFTSVRIQLQNESKTLRVEIKDPTTSKFVTYQTIDLENFDTHPSYIDSIPTKVKVGISFATSDAVTNCDIKNLSIYGDTVDSAIEANNYPSRLHNDEGTTLALSGAGLEA
jgi:hypothetical protein